MSMLVFNYVLAFALNVFSLCLRSILLLAGAPERAEEETLTLPMPVTSPVPSMEHHEVAPASQIQRHRPRSFNLYDLPTRFPRSIKHQVRQSRELSKKRMRNRTVNAPRRAGHVDAFGSSQLHEIEMGTIPSPSTDLNMADLEDHSSGAYSSCSTEVERTRRMSDIIELLDFNPSEGVLNTEEVPATQVNCEDMPLVPKRMSAITDALGNKSTPESTTDEVSVKVDQESDSAGADRTRRMSAIIDMLDTDTLASTVDDRSDKEASTSAAITESHCTDKTRRLSAIIDLLDSGLPETSSGEQISALRSPTPSLMSDDCDSISVSSVSSPTTPTWDTFEDTLPGIYNDSVLDVPGSSPFTTIVPPSSNSNSTATGEAYYYYPSKALATDSSLPHSIFTKLDSDKPKPRPGLRPFLLPEIVSKRESFMLTGWTEDPETYEFHDHNSNAEKPQWNEDIDQSVDGLKRWFSDGDCPV